MHATDEEHLLLERAVASKSIHKPNMPMLLTCRSRSPAVWHRLLWLELPPSCSQLAQPSQQTRSH